MSRVSCFLFMADPVLLLVKWLSLPPGQSFSAFLEFIIFKKDLLYLVIDIKNIVKSWLCNGNKNNHCLFELVLSTSQSLNVIILQNNKNFL